MNIGWKWGMWSHRCVRMLGFAILAAAYQPVHALLANCTASASAVSFGPYDVFSGTPTDAVGDVTVSCSGLGLLVSYDILLSAGSSGSYTSRTMTSGAHSLNYNLYTSAARTTVWGDGSAGTGILSDSYLITLGTVARHYPPYGRIPALQNAFMGVYGDTVIVTVNYF